MEQQSIANVFKSKDDNPVHNWVTDEKTNRNRIDKLDLIRTYCFADFDCQIIVVESIEMTCGG